MSRAHWTAHAVLLLSVVSACLSVYYACSLQRTIGKLYSPELIRQWLQKPGKDDNSYLSASLPAMLVLSAPYTMMEYSIILLFVGLAIYQGFTWTRNLDTDAGQTGSRNIFIVFMVGLVLGGFFFSSATTIKDLESKLLRKRRDDATISWPEMRANTFSNDRQQHSLSGNSTSDLISALRSAAAAHTQSGEADKLVALAYSKLTENMTIPDQSQPKE